MTKTLNKNVDSVVKQCVKKFSDEDLKWICPRLVQRLGGDVAEAVNYIEDNHPELNKLLGSAPDSDSFYDIVDSVEKYAREEFDSRFPAKV